MVAEDYYLVLRTYLDVECSLVAAEKDDPAVLVDHAEHHRDILFFRRLIRIVSGIENASYQLVCRAFARKLAEEILIKGK